MWGRVAAQEASQTQAGHLNAAQNWICARQARYTSPFFSSTTPPPAFPFAHMPINIFIVRLSCRLPACHKSCLILPHNVFPSCTLRLCLAGQGAGQPGDSLCLCLFKKVASLPSFDLIKLRQMPRNDSTFIQHACRVSQSGSGGGVRGGA